MALSEPEAAVGQTIAGRYELVQEIARGGMGTVWVAEDHKLGRRVALKVMRRESLEAFEDARERFEREARAAGALRTAHVVQVHDYGVEDGVPFIAMELLEGESLKDRLARSGTLDVLAAAELLGQVAKGLKAAHQAGLIHRDLKPSNIFITHRDDREVVKLLDFGVVKTVMSRGSEETASGILLGTPQFMSPEQARGLRKIDHRADLWSLAVILYLVLTGDNPFDSDAEAVGDIVIRVCIDPIPPPSVMNPALSEAMDAFFEKALAREPGDRFQSVAELAEGFMVAAEISFGGLDERSDLSGPGLFGGRRPTEPSLGSTPGLGAPRVTTSETAGDSFAPPPEEPSLGGSFLDDPDAPEGGGDEAAVAPRRVSEGGDAGAAEEGEPAESETADPDDSPDAADPDDDLERDDLVEDEWSSAGASMSTSVGGVRAQTGARRSPRLVGGVALAALGLAAAGYALWGGDSPARTSEATSSGEAMSSVEATSSAPPGAGRSGEAVEAPPVSSSVAGSANVVASSEAAPSAAAPSAAAPSAAPPPAPKTATKVTPSPSATGTATASPKPMATAAPAATAPEASTEPPAATPPDEDDGGPPTWFPEDEQTTPRP